MPVSVYVWIFKNSLQEIDSKWLQGGLSVCGLIQFSWVKDEAHHIYTFDVMKF